MRSVDFAVIGGGIAGTSAGYYLASHGKTVVLEQEQVPGYHSTGRSAALFRAYHGPELISRLARASYKLFSEPPEGFTETPLLTSRGVLFIGSTADAIKAAETLEQGNSHPGDLLPMNQAEALKLVPFLKPECVDTGIFYPGAMEIDVAALHQGWIRGLKQRGGELLVKTPVTGITRQNGNWLITTRDESFEAGALINAAGGWADEIARMASIKPLGLIPKRRTMITVELPTEYHNQHYPMVIFLDERFYFKCEAGTVFASPMDATPVEAQDVQPEEMDVATAAWLLEERTTLPVKRILNSWAGLRSFLPDEAPVVGRDPQADNFIWLAGLGGYGIKTCDALARCAVEMMLNDDLPADVKAEGIKIGEISARRFT